MADLDKVNLNLLLSLQALLTEQSVSAAAERLRVSQPTMSYSLKQLRDWFGDPLLVRAGTRMELTPKAEALREPLSALIERVHSLCSAQPFEPGASDREFSVMMPDHVAHVILPSLEDRLRGSAPQVRLRVRAWAGSSFMRSDRARDLDVIIACTSEDFACLHREKLMCDTEALVVATGGADRHPVGSMDWLVRSDHVAVIGQSQEQDPVDAWLNEEGVSRPVRATAASYLQALSLIGSSDLVGILPKRLTATFAKPLGVVALPVPIDPGTFEEYMFFPSRSRLEPGAAWFRAQLRRAAHLATQENRLLSAQGAQETICL